MIRFVDVTEQVSLPIDYPSIAKVSTERYPEELTPSTCLFGEPLISSVELPAGHPEQDLSCSRAVRYES